MTLIELVVAMALFALVAVMGTQALNGVLKSRDRLTGLSAQTAELDRTLTLMRRDLAAALPIPFHAPGGRPESVLAVAWPGPRLGISVGGRAGPATPDFTGFHRVEWIFDDSENRLLRRVWPVLQPASDRERGPAVPMLNGVSGFDVRTFDRDSGWRSWRDVPPDRISTRLPDAVEVTVSTDRFGKVRLFEAIR